MALDGRHRQTRRAGGAELSVRGGVRAAARMMAGSCDIDGDDGGQMGDEDAELPLLGGGG